MSTTNLLPKDYLQRRRQHRGNFICALLFAVVIMSICGAEMVSERNTGRTRQVAQRMDSAYADAAKLIDQVHQLEAQKAKMLDKAKRSAALMERMPRSYLLAMLTTALPKGASLRAVTITNRILTKPHVVKTKSKVVAPAKAPRLAVAMTVTGLATTDVQVARFIARMAANPLTDVVDLAYSRESRLQKYKGDREFQLTVVLKPDADALDAIGDELHKQASNGSATRLSMGDVR